MISKPAAPRIAILGWGSLIWDKRSDFDDWHDDWQNEGPLLDLEFSRISGKTRKHALTLVIDSENGVPCPAQFALSKRKKPEDAIADLRCREGTIMRLMGFYFADNSRVCVPPVPTSIAPWAAAKGIDVVVWTGLPSNFKGEKTKLGLKESDAMFSVGNAIAHLQSLPADGKAMAAEYVWRAPAYVDTPLRRVLQAAAWFKAPEPAAAAAPPDGKV